MPLGSLKGDGGEVIYGFYDCSLGMPSSFILISIIFCASVRRLQASLDCAIDRRGSWGELFKQQLF